MLSRGMQGGDSMEWLKAAVNLRLIVSLQVRGMQEYSRAGSSRQFDMLKSIHSSKGTRT